MQETVETLNFLLALGGIVLAMTIAFLIFDLYTKRELVPLVEKFGLWIAFLVTLGSGAMTLLYSEVFGFVPCGLCWLGRIFMYPQIFLTATALYLRDKAIAMYGMVLSVPGLLISLYHHYLQMGGTELIDCPASGKANCAERILFEFGFMTFPLLSAILFLFLFCLYFYIWKTRN